MPPPGAAEPDGDATAPRVTENRVEGAGLTLSVREHGTSRDAPHVVLVHGYPDSQRLWRRVAERLSGSMHVVTYDVRGAGASDVPATPDGYRVELLVDDLVAVLEATVPPGERVHLVGHDWGSVQLWEAVLSAPEDPRLRNRIASFTSVSGTSLDHIGHLLRNQQGRRLRLLGQLAHSWYVGLFLVPVLPELLWRTVGRRIGPPATQSEDEPRTERAPGLVHDATNGLNLYRANVVRRARRPRSRRTDVPVLAVAPRRDPFLTSVVLDPLDELCSDVTVVRPDTGHWIPREDPALLADLVREHVVAHG